MYITKIRMTKIGILQESLPKLAYEAIYNAINDSNIFINNIDTIVVSNFLGGPLNSQLHLNSVIASILPDINISILKVETACHHHGDFKTSY